MTAAAKTVQAQAPVPGMTYFQEAVFAIEEFINVRKRMNEFKTDKYYLVRTLGRGEPGENCILSSCEHPFKHF